MDDNKQKDNAKETEKKSRYVVYTMDDIKKDIYGDYLDDESNNDESDDDNDKNKKPFFEDNIRGTIYAVICLILLITRIIAVVLWLICSFWIDKPMILCVYALLGYYYWIVEIPISNLSGTPKKGIKKFLCPGIIVFIITIIIVMFKIIPR